MKDYTNKITGVVMADLDRIQKYGWTAHFLLGDENSPNHVNYHTHGLSDNFHHPDLQICLNIDPKVANEIFKAVVRQIQAGAVLKKEISFKNALGMDVLLSCLKAQDEYRNVIRLIFPDENGGFKRPEYANQLLHTSPIQEDDFPS